jgi:cytochrome c-type biogenesis protein CcmH/NrfF
VKPAVAALVAALALAAPAAAAGKCPQTTLGDVEDEVMCVVCKTPLNLATEAPQANRERAFIQRQIDDCRSKEQIKTALAAEFGDDVLGTPDDEGFDLAAWLVPALALLLAAGGIAFAVARWRRAPRDGDPGIATEGSAGDRLDADMERYDL